MDRSQGKGLESHLVCPSATGTTSFSSPCTFDSNALSAAERHQYEQNGFMIKRGLLDDATVADFRQRWKVQIPGFQRDEGLFSFCSHPNVVDVVKAFTGEDVMAMFTTLMYEPPAPGSQTSRYSLHQDLHYFAFRPAERIVCAWTALEHVHRKNGCLAVIPGTHRQQLLPHDYPTWEEGVGPLTQEIPEELVEKHRDGLVYVEMQPGDTVFFHPLLIHGHGVPNVTSCHYASSHCSYIDVSSGSQSKIAGVVSAVLRARLKGKGVPDTDGWNHEDLWRKQARLVAGGKG